MRLAVPLLLALLSFSSGGRAACAAIIVAGFTAERHDRFENNPGFVGAAYDWSGVGRSDTTAWGTLISPSYVIGATHYAPNGTLRFYKTNDPSGGAGTYVERAVAAATQIVGSDLYLARLAAPISAGEGITSYEIATFDAGSYLDREIYTFGLSSGKFTTQADQRLGRNQIDQLILNFSDPVLGPTVGDAILFDYDTINGFVPDESAVQGGDSGAPSFTIVNGNPAVVGLHWFRYDADALNPNPGSGDTFVSSYVDELNLAMLQLTPIGQPVESVRTANVAAVPEPGSLALACAVLLTATCGRKLTRRIGRFAQAI